MVQWDNDTMGQWYNGRMVQWENLTILMITNHQY